MMKRMQQFNPVNLFRVMIACGACVVLAFAIGCGNGTDEPAAIGDEVDEVDAVLSEFEIPTQEELDAEAAAEITPENADEIFRDLEEQIMSDDDD